MCIWLDPCYNFVSERSLKFPGGAGGEVVCRLLWGENAYSIAVQATPTVRGVVEYCFVFVSADLAT